MKQLVIFSLLSSIRPASTGKVGTMTKNPATPDMTVKCASETTMRDFILWTDHFQSKEDRQAWSGVSYSVAKKEG